MSCGVCTEKYTNHTRKCVTCPHCDYTSCKSCYKTFLLTKTEAQCMNCKTIWDDDYLATWFPKTWIKEDFRAHQSNVYYQREKSLFPLSMQVIERERLELQRTEYTSILNSLDDKLTEARRRLGRHQNNCKIRASVEKKTSSAICQDCVKLTDEFTQAETKYTDQFNLIVKFNEDNGLNDDKHKVLSTRPCLRQGCKGYINAKWKCILCDTQFCTECREIQKSDHKCNEETVKTIKLIENDTKNCPNCKELIFRISGCDQMFCVKCNTGFNWITGQIETGRIHNPHYFDYLNRTRQNNDQQGGGRRTIIVDENGCEELSEKLLSEAAAAKNISKSDYAKYIQILFRLKIHIDDYEIPGLGIQADVTLVNQDLRLNFLRERINEKQFVRTIFTVFQERKRKIKLSNVFVTMSNVLRDILVKFIKDANMKLKNVSEEFIEIKKYINLELYRHAEKYNLNAYSFIPIGPTDNTFERKKFIKDLNINIDLENVSIDRAFMNEIESRHAIDYFLLAKQAVFIELTLGKHSIKSTIDKTYKIKKAINPQQSVRHLLAVFDNNSRNARLLSMSNEIQKCQKEKRDYRILNKIQYKTAVVLKKMMEMVKSYKEDNEQILVTVPFFKDHEVFCLIHHIPMMCPGFPNEIKTFEDGRVYFRIELEYWKKFWDTPMVIIDMKPATVHEVLFKKYLEDESPIKGSYAQWQIFYEHFKHIKRETSRGTWLKDEFRNRFTTFLMGVLNNNKLKSKSSVYYSMRSVVSNWWGQYYNLRLNDTPSTVAPRPASPRGNSGCGDPNCDNCNPELRRNRQEDSESDHDSDIEPELNSDDDDDEYVEVVRS
jgi:hypothetical protein